MVIAIVILLILALVVFLLTQDGQLFSKAERATIASDIANIKDALFIQELQIAEDSETQKITRVLESVNMNVDGILISKEEAQIYPENMDNSKIYYPLEIEKLKAHGGRGNGSLSENHIVDMFVANSDYEVFYIKDATTIGTDIWDAEDEEITEETQWDREEIPHRIQSIEDLVAFSVAVNNGHTYEGETVELTRTLDFNEDLSYREPSSLLPGGLKEQLTDEQGNGFTPIGSGTLELITSTVEPEDPNGEIDYDQRLENAIEINLMPFKGEFNGNQHEIRNVYLVVKNPELEEQVEEEPSRENISINVLGLFGATQNATIKNLGITGTAKTEQLLLSMGGIVAVGIDNLTMENCYNKLNVDSKCNLNFNSIQEMKSTLINDLNENLDGAIVGGVCGLTFSNANAQVSILNCKNYGKIAGGLVSAGVIGGAIGYDANLNVTVSNCENTSEINGLISSGVIGGTIGLKVDKDVNVTNCANNGSINGLLATGIMAGNISVSSLDILLGEINNMDESIISEGSSQLAINSCINRGEIKGLIAAVGIEGACINMSKGNTTEITNCTSGGNLLGIATVGIFGGNIAISEDTTTIKKCYSPATMQGLVTVGFVGGSILLDDATVVIEDCDYTGKMQGYLGTGIHGVFVVAGDNNNCTIRNCNNRKEISSILLSTGISVGYMNMRNNIEEGAEIEGNSFKITNCNNYGNLQSFTAGTGLLSIILAEQSNTNATIEKCKNVGNISIVATENAYAKAIETFNSTAMFSEIQELLQASLPGNGVFCAGIIGMSRLQSPSVESIVTINECSNSGQIYIKSEIFEENTEIMIGGLYGYNPSDDTIDEYGNITGNRVDIINSYNKGNIVFDGNASLYAGGICGTSVNIYNSYNSGNINVNLVDSPAVLGGVSSVYFNARCTMNNVFNSGTIDVRTTDPEQYLTTGGFLGQFGYYEDTEGLEFINCYYNNDNEQNAIGDNEGEYTTIDTITGYNSTYMRSNEFNQLLNSGLLPSWKSWKIVSGNNNGFPTI